MSFFDDIRFLTGDINPQCTAVINLRFPGFFTLELIQSGKMLLGIDGGPMTLIDRPAIFWHHPRLTYQYGPPEGASWHHHWFSFIGTRGKRFIEKGWLPLSEKGFVYVARPSRIAELFEEIVTNIKENYPATHTRTTLLMEEILAVVLEDHQRESAGDPQASAITKTIEQVRRDPLHKYDFHTIASESSISYSHYRRLFRRIAGTPPHEFVLSSRMKWAARRLEDPSCQVKEAAMEAGYIDPAQFAKAFKGKMGLSPREFRRMRGRK